MTLTVKVTLPSAASMPPIAALLPIAEPVLMLAAGAIGFGPVGQVVLATALRSARFALSR